MVEIYMGATPENKKKADVDVSFEMIRQVMDIFDISIRAVDHSKTIKMPMTAINKEIMEGLGFVDSLFPYKRSYADVYVSGILMMKDAFVQVKEYEDKYYSVSLISESKEIWKLVENDTLGDLDLEDTAHTKSADLIKTQWETGLTPAVNFLYLLADYGGKIPSDNTVYADFLVPSYRLSYLVGKINSKYDVNIELPGFLDDTFITFSDANEIEETNDKVVYEKLHQPPTAAAQLIAYPIEEDGDYIIEIQGTYVALSGYLDVHLGSFTHRFTDPSQLFDYTSPVISARKGETFYFAGYFARNQWHLSGSVKVIRKAIDVSGNKAFQNYKINDFLKEIIYQSAAIPIKTDRDYHFTTLTEIVTNNASDWSRFYDKKGRTTVIIGKYGQNNWLRYKYAEPEDQNKDGLISVPNVNLETNKDIIKSTLYNTPVNSIPFTLGGTDFTSQQYHLWKRTVEQKAGIFEERYQGQSGRMFLLSGVEHTAGSFTIEAGASTVTATKLILANNEDYNFQTVVNKRYIEFSKILKNAKVVEAVFKIPLIEFSSFDFKRRVYVSQLEGYYIVNRIVYKSGELMTVELLEANITPENLTPIDPVEPNSLTMVFESNVATEKSRYIAPGTVFYENILIIGDVTGATLDLTIDGVSWPSSISGNVITFSIEADVNLPYGTHELLISGVENPIYYTITNPKPGVEGIEPAPF